MHRRRKYKLAAAIVVGLALLAAVALLLQSLNIPVLNPKGLIAHEQRNLIIFTIILSLFVIIPVYTMTFLFAWRYREHHRTSRHAPDWEKSNAIEAVMGGVPIVIILILSVVTWRTSHSLDPFRPIESDKKPLTVQVVSLQWKWLFIYPEQKIATVNYFQMPKDVPVVFEITSDAPMNSFWIPALGSQIYSMNGMTTKLHLVAHEVGKYNGSSANISGAGFADMKFVAEAVEPGDFIKWVSSIQKSTNELDMDEYEELVKPSSHVRTTEYVLAKEDLHRTIVMKHMAPASSSKDGHGKHGGSGR
jgi:cytochrome o ubiquinol oxidase subunit 2